MKRASNYLVVVRDSFNPFKKKKVLVYGPIRLSKRAEREGYNFPGDAVFRYLKRWYSFLLPNVKSLIAPEELLKEKVSGFGDGSFEVSQAFHDFQTEEIKQAVDRFTDVITTPLEAFNRWYLKTTARAFIKAIAGIEVGSSSYKTNDAGQILPFYTPLLGPEDFLKKLNQLNQWDTWSLEDTARVMLYHIVSDHLGGEDIPLEITYCYDE